MSSYKIDVHQHFWKYKPEEYTWISDDMDILKRDFLLDDYRKARSGTDYKASISIQARQSSEETDWLLKLASENPDIIGVVGWLDLCSGGIVDLLGQYSSNIFLKGLRHVIHDEPDDNFMLRPDFLNGISCLKEAGFLYEILIFPRHLPNTIRLLELFPGQKFVLDHCAKPDIKNGEIIEWAGLIKRLASFPNISCKLSGLVTEADWHSWEKEDFYPYLDVIWNAFGKERIMLGSDWPVCLVSATFPTVTGLMEGYFEQFGDDVLSGLTSLNARHIYGLQNIE